MPPPFEDKYYKHPFSSDENAMGLGTIEQIRAFMAGTDAIGFSMDSTPKPYALIQGTLIGFVAFIPFEHGVADLAAL